MNLNQAVTVRTNPLYLDSAQAAVLKSFFEALGIDDSNIHFTPAIAESGAVDPTSSFEVEYTVNMTAKEGTRYSFARNVTLQTVSGDLLAFKHRFKLMRDQWVADCYKNIAIWLLEDIDAGTFALADVRAILDGALNAFPSIDV